MANSIKQRLISGGLWVFSGRILVLTSGLIVNALLARMLAPEEMGAYFLAFSLVVALACLAQSGTLKTVVRLVSESLSVGQPERARSAVRNVFLIGGAGTLTIVLMLLLGVGQWLVVDRFKSQSMSDYMLLIIAWVALLAMQGLISESFRAFSDIRFATVFDRLFPSVITVFVLGAIWLNFGVTNLEIVLYLTIFALAASVLVGGFLLFFHVRKLGNVGTRTTLREILVISLPLLVVALSPVVLDQGGLWILGANRPSEEVAIFASVQRLISLISMPLMVVNGVMAPMIGEMYARGEKVQLEFYLRRTATVAGVIAGAIIAIFVGFGDQILGLVYGDFYRAGHEILVILCLGALVNVWSGSCGLTLMMTGGQKTIMRITMLSGILLVAGSLLTVRSFGIVGVAVTTSIVGALQFILLVMYARKHAGIWTQMTWPGQLLRQRSGR